MNKKFLLVTMICTLLLGATLSGCIEPANQATEDKINKSETAVNNSSQVNTKSENLEDNAVIYTKLYYPDEQGAKLIGVSYSVKNQDDKYKKTLEALLSGAKNPQQWSIIPKKTKLNSIRLDNGVAFVDFSKHIVKNFGGGSTGEEMLVGSIVNTLTEFPEIKKVKITIEGKNIETIAGHMDLSTTIERMPHLL